MYLFTSPQGPHVTSQQAKMLDDEFFLSDPLGHFTSRIAALLQTQHKVEEPTRETHPEFFTALGLRGVTQMPGFRGESRQPHAAVDALALRHQAAEALSRFLYAVSTATPLQGGHDCTWLKVASSPTANIDVVEANVSFLRTQPDAFLELLLPAGMPLDEEAMRGADNAVDWIDHAAHLLTSDELSMNVAHNKVKHGLAVSIRSDIRIEVTTTPPNDDGTIPLSAFADGKSMPIFDRPLLTYLDRPKRPRQQGWEAVSLRVDLPVVLAETWMMATVYAALFHVAARNHFGDELPEKLAAYPTMVVDRDPEKLTGGQVLGARSPLTTPLDGSAPRDSGIFMHGAFWPLTINFESGQTVVVVED